MVLSSRIQEECPSGVMLRSVMNIAPFSYKHDYLICVPEKEAGQRSDTAAMAV